MKCAAFKTFSHAQGLCHLSPFWSQCYLLLINAKIPSFFILGGDGGVDSLTLPSREAIWNNYKHF